MALFYAWSQWWSSQVGYNYRTCLYVLPHMARPRQSALTLRRLEKRDKSASAPRRNVLWSVIVLFISPAVFCSDRYVNVYACGPGLPLPAILMRGGRGWRVCLDDVVWSHTSLCCDSFLLLGTDCRYLCRVSMAGANQVQSLCSEPLLQCCRFSFPIFHLLNP